MSIARIRGDLAELLHAGELLIEHRLTYEDALADYVPRLLACYGGDHTRVFSFDNSWRALPLTAALIAEASIAIVSRSAASRQQRRQKLSIDVAA